MSTTPQPVCFDDELQWAQWRRFARLSRTDPDAPFAFCTDCTHAYKAQMVREDRCANRAGVIEVVEEEDDFVSSAPPVDPFA